VRALTTNKSKESGFIGRQGPDDHASWRARGRQNAYCPGVSRLIRTTRLSRPLGLVLRTTRCAAILAMAPGNTLVCRGNACRAAPRRDGIQGGQYSWDSSWIAIQIGRAGGTSYIGAVLATSKSGTLS